MEHQGTDTYIVVNGSDSGHCCFRASVVDAKAYASSGCQKGLICETFTEEAAEMIRDALNAQAAAGGWQRRVVTGLKCQECGWTGNSDGADKSAQRVLLCPKCTIVRPLKTPDGYVVIL